MATNKDFVVKNGLVVGQNITVTGTITQAGMSMPASDGTAGQYLKTDGSGNLTWATVTSNFVIGDGSTTDTVNGGETLTFTGGTGIDATVTANTVTIDLNTNTDGVAEGSSNLYHTTARAISAIEGAAHLTIDGGTLYVDTSNNYVGIGDTSPSYPLDVAGAIGVNGSQVISSGGVITGAVADSALTIGGSLAGVLSNLKVQYGTAYSGTPIQGSFFFDSLNQKLKVYTGSAFVDAVPAGSGGGGGGGATDANTTFRNYSYTLTGTTSAVSGIDDNEIAAGAFIIGHKYTITTAGNTDFTAIGAADSNVNTVFTATGVGTGTGVATQTLFYDTTSSTTRVVAYVNGIKQVYGSGRDFVATTGTSVAFTYNLGAGDTVDLQVYELLTNAAYYLKSEVYTQTQVNSQISTGVSSYLPLAGGTLSGGLDVNSTARVLANNALYFMNTNNSASSYLKNTLGAGAADLRLGVLGDDKVTILSNGNVGIGTATPAAKLQVNQTNTTAPSLTFGAAAGQILRNEDAEFAFGLSNAAPYNLWMQGRYTANTPRNIAIQPLGGNVGIGTSSPAAPLDARTTHTSTDVTAANSNSTVIVGNSGVGNGIYNAIKFAGNQQDMYIMSFNNSATASRRLGFFVGSVAGDAVADERLSIMGNGNVGIGTTTPSSQLMIECNAAVKEPVRINDSNASGSTYKHRIAFQYQGAEVGSVTANNAGVSYNTTSDRRLKDNIQPIADATYKLMNMKPVTHTWINNPDNDMVHGFIAQEMQEVVPEAVSGDADSDKMMSMDYGRITPIIVAALQDALKEIKELKTRINTLENN